MEINNNLQILFIFLIITMSFIGKEKNFCTGFTQGSHVALNCPVFLIFSKLDSSSVLLYLSFMPLQASYFVDYSSVRICLMISLDKTTPEVMYSSQGIASEGIIHSVRVVSQFPLL